MLICRYADKLMPPAALPAALPTARLPREKKLKKDEKSPKKCFTKSVGCETL